MAEEFDDLGQFALTEDEAALLEAMPELSDLSELGETRRTFLKQAAALGLTGAALHLLSNQQIFAGVELKEQGLVSPIGDENPVTVRLKVNGVERTVTLDSRTTLLDALRERLGLTGSKKGCDHGQCGACTVIVDGRRVLSCLTLSAQCEGKSVTTIEGLANGATLHPMQAAFIKHDGFQCGFCTPGQICSAVALMDEAKSGEASYVTKDISSKARPTQLSDEEIRERMSGNLCRCGAYPNILSAIKEIHSGKPVDAVAWEFVGEKKEAKDASI